MLIYLNDQPITLNTKITLAALLQQKEVFAEHIAVAINQRFIPKPLFTQTTLQEGDKIDLIVPMQGG